MKPVFIDTNIFIYASGDSHPYKNPSKYLLTKIAKNEIKAVINSEVLQEILYRYCVINDLARGFAIFDDCIHIIPLILPVNRQDMIRAREILSDYTSLQSRDAIHTAVMVNHGIKTIYSYDKHFDGLKEVKRIEP